MTEATTALEIKRKQKIDEEKQLQADLEELIPTPVGYRVLIAEKTKHEEYILSTIGLVLDMGEQAYADTDRFSTGPWCKPGDYVMFRANTGTRFKIGSQEYRLMNDDSIEAVVPEPRAISRA